LHALFITAKALPPARTNATVSAITSDVFMAKLAWPDASVIVLLALELPPAKLSET
jgi:hypothetical protein